jgi:hypothetical protein
LRKQGVCKQQEKGNKKQIGFSIHHVVQIDTTYKDTPFFTYIFYYLVVCSIVKIHPKMMRVKPINAGQYYRGDGYLAYPDNCIVVDGPDVMAYILKGPQ